MPSLNFKGQFVERVRNGTKTHSIRKRRKRNVFTPGCRVCLFTRMRTKDCERIRPDQVCSAVQSIWIFSDGSVYLSDRRLAKDEILHAGARSGDAIWDALGARQLSDDEKERLAIADGFPSFDTFMRYWRIPKNAGGPLPFFGDLIHWKEPTTCANTSPRAVTSKPV